MTHVFFPIHPIPAYCAYTRSWTGPVSTYARASNGSSACVLHPCEQATHSLADHMVIVAAPRVPRDFGACCIGALGRVRVTAVIERAGNDDRPRRRDHVAHVRAPLGTPRQVAHRAGITARDPLLEERELRKGLCWCDAAEIEAHLTGPILYACACEIHDSTAKSPRRQRRRTELRS